MDAADIPMDRVVIMSACQLVCLLAQLILSLLLRRELVGDSQAADEKRRRDGESRIFQQILFIWRHKYTQ